MIFQRASGGWLRSCPPCYDEGCKGRSLAKGRCSDDSDPSKSSSSLRSIRPAIACCSLPKDGTCIGRPWRTICAEQEQEFEGQGKDLRCLTEANFFLGLLRDLIAVEVMTCPDQRAELPIGCGQLIIGAALNDFSFPHH